MDRSYNVRNKVTTERDALPGEDDWMENWITTGDFMTPIEEFQPKMTVGSYSYSPHSIKCECPACKPNPPHPSTWAWGVDHGVSVKGKSFEYLGDPPPGYHVVMRLEKINPTKIERPEDV